MSGMVAAAIAFWAIIVGVSTMGFVALARGKRKERDESLHKIETMRARHEQLLREIQDLHIVIVESERETARSKETITPGPAFDSSGLPSLAAAYKNQA